MEYPFKDLMPLDEATARDGYYKDWTHIDADTFHQISELAKFIREKGRGSDTREAIAQALERVYHDAAISGNANMEVSQARGSYPSLGVRLDEVDDNQRQTDEQLAQKANQAFVDSQFSSIVSGAPKGTYTDLAALQSAYPSGAKGVFLVLSNGHWYYWNSTTSAWTDGGVYQATGSSEFPATNIATNGNFANGITGWRAEGGTLTATEGEATMTFSSLSVTTRVERTLDDIVPNHKYYIRTEIYPKFSNVTYYSIGDSSIPNVQQPFYPDANKWNKVSQIQTSKTNARFRVYHRTNTNYSVEDTFKIKNVVVIDLTKTFGFGNEPSRSEMDEILSKYPNSYFEGTVAPLLSNKDIYLDFTAFLTEQDKEWVL